VDARDEEIRRVILRILYPRDEGMEPPEPISVHDLSVATDVDDERIKANLADLQGKGPRLY